MSSEKAVLIAEAPVSFAKKVSVSISKQVRNSDARASSTQMSSPSFNGTSEIENINKIKPTNKLNSTTIGSKNEADNGVSKEENTSKTRYDGSRHPLTIVKPHSNCTNEGNNGLEVQFQTEKILLENNFYLSHTYLDRLNLCETVFKVFINKNTVDKESNDCIGSSFNGSASTFPTAPSEDSTASSNKDNGDSTGYNPSECSRDRNHDGPEDGSSIILPDEKVTEPISSLNTNGGVNSPAGLTIENHSSSSHDKKYFKIIKSYKRTKKKSSETSDINFLECPVQVHQTRC